MAPAEQLARDIKKACRHGVTEEQLAFFLEREPRSELLPYYARYVGKMGPAAALAQLHLEFGAPGEKQEQNRTL